MDGPILPACYLPPVTYFATVLRWKETGIRIEQHEHFPKQTYRNRASIYGANGQLDLIIPVSKGSRRGVHTKMKDVQISYDADWQRLHWLSMQTAYRSSSYFEYYEDAFAGFYEQRFPLLLEYNMQLTRLILDLLKIDVRITLTETFEKEYPQALDFRERIHPKKKTGVLMAGAEEPEEKQEPIVYHQVFSDRHGFLPDLSIVDLLFNQGPQSLEYLTKVPT